MLKIWNLTHAFKGAAFILALLVSAPLSAQEDSAGGISSDGSSITVFVAAQDTELNEGDLAVLMVPLSAEELSEVANIWLKELRSVLDEAAILNLALKSADETQAKSLRARLSVVTKVQYELKLRYEQVLDN